MNRSLQHNAPLPIIEDPSWIEANQRYLNMCIDVVFGRVDLFVNGTMTTESMPLLPPPLEHCTSVSALDMLTSLFGLSSFERAVLVLLAGVELNSKLARLCRIFHGEGYVSAASFGLALAVLPDPSWSALLPTAPLRFYQLITVQPSVLFTSATIQIDERILHILTGLHTNDVSLAGRMRKCREAPFLSLSRCAIGKKISICLQYDKKARIAIQAPSLVVAEEIVHFSTVTISARAFVVDASTLPSDPIEFDRMVRRIDRETLLLQAIILIDASASSISMESLRKLLDQSISTIAVFSNEEITVGDIAFSRFVVPPLSSSEGVAHYQHFLGLDTFITADELKILCDRFHPEPSQIEKSCRNLYAFIDNETAPILHLAISLRQSVHTDMGHLAERIDPRATWDDLILPEQQKKLLEQMIDQMHHRSTVYYNWGFAAKSGRGLGITALFCGLSGTGKTMAAEVIANELDLDLYRIDLSQVVSKYIGETEKNLSRVFDTAEKCSAILLFDEADALFSKRSEVKDSHDRYANIEVGYLLQRMDSYSGVAILTTNHRESLDEAFIRRLRFIISFPFPSTIFREQIWERIFPATAPREELDIKRLAQINASGGTIRNIALGAAFIAASQQEAIGYRHVRIAASAEYHKLDRTLSEGEVAGWPE